ncbi:MAG: hypothetical protein B6U94_07800, partial [Thermofilum sp. ex4484_79]
KGLVYNSSSFYLGSSNFTFRVIAPVCPPGKVRCNIRVNYGDIVLNNTELVIENMSFFQYGRIVSYDDSKIVLRGSLLVVDYVGNSSPIELRDNTIFIVENSTVYGTAGSITVSGDSEINVSHSDISLGFTLYGGSPIFYIFDSNVSSILKTYSDTGGIYTIINSDVNEIVCNYSGNYYIVNSSVGLSLWPSDNWVLSLNTGYHSYWNLFLNETIPFSQFNLTLINCFVDFWKIFFYGSYTFRDNFNITILNSSGIHAWLEGTRVLVKDTWNSSFVLKGCYSVIASSSLDSLNIPRELGTINVIILTDSFIDIAVFEGTSNGVITSNGYVSEYPVNASIINCSLGLLKVSTTNAYVVNSSIVDLQCLSDGKVTIYNSSVENISVSDYGIVNLINSSMEVYDIVYGDIYVYWYITVVANVYNSPVSGSDIEIFYVSNNSLAAKGITGPNGDVRFILLEKNIKGVNSNINVVTYRDYIVRATYSGKEKLYNKTLNIMVDTNKLVVVYLTPRVYLNLYVKSSPSYVGFRVDFTGRLYFSNDTGIGDKVVRLEYSSDGMQSWSQITTVVTSSNGSFIAQWSPQASGNYVIRASTDIDGYAIVDFVSLIVQPYREKYVFSVVSNSTVYDFAFNSSSLLLSFVVDGPSGTTGFVNVTIAKTIVSDTSGIKVYMDGKLVSYNVYSLDSSWLLHFSYTHSRHSVLINLKPQVRKATRLIELYPGWNLVSLPLDTGSNIDSYILANMFDGKCRYVSRWDPVQQKFITYIPGVSPSEYVFNISIGTGYFVYVSDSVSSSINGTTVTSIDIRLVRGWNIIGWPLGNLTASELANIIGDKTRYISKWDPVNDRFITYIPGISPKEYDFEVRPGEGYFIYVDGDIEVVWP